MKTHLITLVLIFSSIGLCAQRFDLGSYLKPTTSDFEYLGTSSRTGVSTYKYKREKPDLFFSRKIGDITVGVRDGVITLTIYNLVPNNGDYGVPADILKLIGDNFPYPFKEVNGVYGLNIDNETISISRATSPLTFNKDRIMFVNSVKQSILESTKNNH